MRADKVFDIIKKDPELKINKEGRRHYSYVSEDILVEFDLGPKGNVPFVEILNLKRKDYVRYRGAPLRPIIITKTNDLYRLIVGKDYLNF